MKQIRLYASGSEEECQIAFDVLGQRFEDDGYALATMEVDESSHTWEVSLYAGEDEVEWLAAAMQACLEPVLPALSVSVETLPDIDWIEHSLAGLPPVRAGRFVVHGSHHSSQLRAGNHGIEIDAGRAFGTGHHGTTDGCLEMLDRLSRARAFKRVLDLGTGSGVLAIAAARLSPASILATDTDPVAIDVARQNTRKNRCGPRIRLATARGFHANIFAEAGPFDLIIANILARPLMQLAPDLKRNLAPGGDVILSGILSEQRRKVLSAYTAQRLYHRRTLWRDGWVTLHLGS
ncbi:MAG: 50S ribosomal protein L11 methyltransferase [Pseudomonadota bacterium]